MLLLKVSEHVTANVVQAVQTVLSLLWFFVFIHFQKENLFFMDGYLLFPLRWYIVSFKISIPLLLCPLSILFMLSWIISMDLDKLYEEVSTDLMEWLFVLDFCRRMVSIY
jgi:hypothetical protein